jgi:uncharacterized membrane protein HdeD (DUF308 family)
MQALKGLETTMAGWFKGAPKLSDSSKETVVKILPWLALIGGILQLISAWALFAWANTANELVDYANEISRAFGVEEAVVDRWTMWLWIGLAIVVVQAIILLVAYPKLKKRDKGGWDLLFLSGLISVVYSIVSLFMEYRGGAMGLAWNLLVAAVIFYLLFAVRDKYKGVSTPA